MWKDETSLEKTFILLFSHVVVLWWYYAPHNYKVRCNLEARYIALLKPTLNVQKDIEILTLFRNGATWVPTLLVVNCIFRIVS